MLKIKKTQLGGKIYVYKRKMGAGKGGEEEEGKIWVFFVLFCFVICS